jgi:hypothetical protein
MVRNCSQNRCGRNKTVTVLKLIMTRKIILTVTKYTTCQCRSHPSTVFSMSSILYWYQIHKVPVSDHIDPPYLTCKPFCIGTHNCPLAVEEVTVPEAVKRLVHEQSKWKKFDSGTRNVKKWPRCSFYYCIKRLRLISKSSPVYVTNTKYKSTWMGCNNYLQLLYEHHIILLQPKRLVIVVPYPSSAAA